MESVAGFPKREAQAVGLVSFAHMLSHLYMLPLAPLLLSLETDLGINKAEFGAALAAYAISTGILQTPVGLLVERIGGRVVLIAGLFLTSLSFLMIGLFVTEFWQLVAFMALAGVGNSVFHPADYSLLSSSVDDKRMGRAFSIHTFVGHIGFIAGPIITAALEPLVGWRGAVMAIGIVGLVMTVVLIVFIKLINEGTRVKKKDGVGGSLRELFSSPPVLLFFVFYMASSAANIGITQFSVAAFQDMYGLERVTAVFALTAYQVGALMLVLPGGILADRTNRYDLVMVVGFGIAGVLILISGTGLLPFWLVVGALLVAGAMRGGVNASRDVAVRHVARHVPIGTVFGFISTGFLIGQAVGAPFYGWLYDNYSPNLVFYCSAAVYVVGIATVLFNPGTRVEVRAPQGGE